MNICSDLKYKKKFNIYNKYSRFFGLNKPNKYTSKNIVELLSNEKQKYSLFQTFKINTIFNDAVVLTVEGWFDNETIDILLKKK